MWHWARKKIPSIFGFFEGLEDWLKAYGWVILPKEVAAVLGEICEVEDSTDKGSLKEN